jgi:hypothetical protein
MRRMTVSTWLSLVLIGAMGITPASAADGTSSQRFRFSGGRVQALLESLNPASCVWYRFYFSGIAGVVQEVRRPQASSMLVVDVLVYNRCTGEFLPSLFGMSESLPADAVRIDRQLDRATIDATITVADFDGNEATLSAALAFTGVGPLDYRSLDRSQYKSDHFFERSFSRTTRREAEPIGGVTLNGQALPLEPSFCRGGGGCSVLNWTQEGRLSLDFSARAEAWGTTASTSFQSGALSTTTGASLVSTQASKSLSASLDAVDACVVTFVDLYGTSGVVRSTSGPESVTDLQAYLSRFNFCTFEELLSAGSEFRAPVPPGTVLEINQALTTARVQSAIPVFDFYTAELVATVEPDLSLAASGPVSARYSDMSLFMDPLGSSLTQNRGTDRPASVSGTVRIGSQTLTATPATAGLLTSGTQTSVSR